MATMLAALPRFHEVQWRCYICRSWNPWSSQVCHSCGRVR